MVPNGSAYSNFPPFATNGTKPPPGGSPESAKYALGMVPADTFPAEWANYLFYGATAGITRLNADTDSIKKEINSVLDNFNITSDGTLTDQFMTALNKLKAEAALAAHPVGSLYWTSSSENPAVTFGGGTWVQIKDRFVLAAGDTYANGAMEGSATVKLTESNLPAHTHTCSSTSTNHVHSGTTGTVSDKYGAANTGRMNTNQTHTHDQLVYTGNTSGISNIYAYSLLASNKGKTNSFGYAYEPSYEGAFTGYPYNKSTNIDHSHSFDHAHDFSTGGMSANSSHTHTISGGGNGTASGNAHENMPPYICKFCWERVS